MTYVKKYATIVFISLLFLAGMYWFMARETTPKPGESIPDLGRDHVADSTPVTYNSNPPTSGPHNSQWEKAGIYDKPLNERKLIHSLEHGYIIISYNCDYKKQSNLRWPVVGKVSAHVDENDKFIEEANNASAASHLDLSKWKGDVNCQQLVTNLTDLANKKRVWKLVVVPRPNLDNRIALTAWTRLDKFYDFNEARIVAFIDAYRDRGPEKTME